MRRITFPTFEPKPCEPCKETGKLRQEVRCGNCGTPVVEEVACQLCEGLGKIPPTKPQTVLRQTLAPTMQESQQGKGVDWEKYAVYHPLVMGLKESEETGTLFLTNEQWTALGECIKKTQWRGYDEEIYAVLASVMNAPDEEAEKVTELNRSQRRELTKSDGRR